MVVVSSLIPAVPAAASPVAAADKTVYFTFDDGPGPGTTELLDAAAAYDAKVSLFYVGRRGEENPELVARAAADGHVIGNHTYSHERLTDLTGSQVYQQLVKGREALQPYVSNCWRPPGWFTSPAIEQAAKSLGMRQTLSVMDPAESRHVFIPAAWTDEDKIVSTVQQRVFDGAMVTLHAEAGGAGAQLHAFQRLLPLLTGRGYHFKALPYCGMPTYKLLAVGDGITTGSGARNGMANYRTRLDGLLRRGAEPRGLNYRWVGSVANSPRTGLNHDGHNGWTVQQLYRNVTRLQAAYQPDVILLNVGTFNIVRGETAGTVSRRMTALLGLIRRNQPDVEVLVSIPPGLGRVKTAALQRQNTALQSTRRDVIDAAGSGFHPVDLRGIAVAPPYDSALPNYKIAYRYYQALRGALPDSRTWAAVPDPYHRAG